MNSRPSTRSPSSRGSWSPSTIARLAANSAGRGLVAIGSTHSNACDEPVGRQHGLDEADAQRFRGVDDARGKDHLGRATRADEPGEPLGAAPAGDDADRDLRLAEVRPFARDPQRACQRELAAAAPRLAVDRGDDRLRHGGEQSERAAPRPRVAFHRFAASERHQVVEVGVGDEVTVDTPGEHQHRDLGIIGNAPEEALEFGHRGHRHEVARRTL